MLSSLCSILYLEEGPGSHGRLPSPNGRIPVRRRPHPRASPHRTHDLLHPRRAHLLPVRCASRPSDALIHQHPCKQNTSSVILIAYTITKRNSPPKSLHPARSNSPAMSGPILTQDAWMLVKPAGPSVSLPTACARMHSRSVGPRLDAPGKHNVHTGKQLENK